MVVDTWFTLFFNILALLSVVVFSLILIRIYTVVNVLWFTWTEYGLLV